jgi:branched-subunit amino acid transport protein
MRTWLIIAGMGLVTYAIRLSAIALFGRLEMPSPVRNALRFVPPAVLTALITPAVVRPEGPVDLSLANSHLLAGLAAAVVAWWTRNTLLTIGAGMAALSLLTSLGR